MLNLRNEVSRRPLDPTTLSRSCAIAQRRAYAPLSRRATALSSKPCGREPQPVCRTDGPGSNHSNTATADNARLGNARLYHSSNTLLRNAGASFNKPANAPVFNPAIHSLDHDPELSKDVMKSNIRQQLRLWNDQHHQDNTPDHSDGGDVNEFGEAGNNFTRLGDVDNFRSPLESAEDERDEIAQIAHARVEELDEFDPHHRFLRKGDLVELEYPRSERESVIAVFVRRVGDNPPQSQFYTMHGKWIHLGDKSIQYSNPDWVDSALVDPIIPYLPENGVDEALLDRAQMFDLSVPRDVSAPLVSRMLQFQRESDEVYRKHASSLDNAHEVLAHSTDLKFGTVQNIAVKLLGITDRSREVSSPELFTVRKALMRAGFAFGSDKRSHRITGFIQIRSKEQVAMVEKVRNWIREWQDALAVAAASKRPPVFRRNATIVNNFIVKARGLIEHSRQTRKHTGSGRVAASSTRFAITPTQNAMKETRTIEFSESDRSLIRFMEGWAASNLFFGLPRVEALPPLILQATGMYEDNMLNSATGFMFLQEIGVLMPHENRVRFDQHLLLPSSQHSKPLTKLSTTVMEMAKDPDIVDSMRDLRKDWGDLPVFCIDSEGAHEIDDGLSVEEDGDNHWVHIHIANPTAFFDREHPLAKFARHMTETIYMPERPFMMLPSWVTKNHLSLQKNRPCLTFSAKLNSEGETLEHKITSGFIRNVHHLSPEVVAKALGVHDANREDQILTVGGEIPPRTPRDSSASLTPKNLEMLKTIQHLAEKRQSLRSAAGGLFLDSHRPEISVWNTWQRPGLEQDAPSRYKARFVEGEPIIEYRTKEFVSWFSPSESVSEIFVQEMMLLACEIGALWCAERNVPVIFRGTIPHPYSKVNVDVFYKEVMVPAMAKNNGEAPMHLAMEYLANTGTTVLTTDPLKHKVLGLPAYSKITSPLRRYGDMIFHWQVEAALREEAKTKQSLVGSKRSDYLPFSAANLNQIKLGLQPREMMIRRATRYSEDHWATQLFFRAFYHGEYELPRTFHAYINQKPRQPGNEIAILLKEYSFPASMIKPETLGMSEVKPGDLWEAEIVLVDCFHRKILTKPIRLVSREE